MSAILGVFGSATPLRDRQLHAMLDAMHARGIERVGIWRDEDAILAVGRYEWELEPHFSGSTLVAVDDRYAVVADASLYYRNELLAALDAAGVRPRGDSVADLLLAAYHAWGDDAPLHLDSDCAFIVWDRRARRVAAFRDYGSKRPLHYAVLGRELVLASSIAGVVAHPRCSTALNLDVVAGTAAGLLFSAGPETVYEAVHVLSNAHRLTWQDGRVSGPERYWEPPFGEPDPHLSQADAAVHLRDLLSTATRERMIPDEPNTVWMSGGWDSSSVFGAASNAARAANFTVAPRPVSISYPVGDPGREDEWIEAIARLWGVPIHWIDIADIPLFDREEERAAQRDEPYAHLYEKWNTALAVGSRACGSRIALDGNGGDQLFQNSDIFLADLFRSGRWLRLAREWPTRPRGGLEEFLSTVVKPNLGPSVTGVITRLRGGRRPRNYLERRMPEWLNADFASSRRLAERDLEHVGRPIDVTHAQREMDWQFTCSFVARAFANITRWSLAAGVEVRSPLSDRRVIEFALSRPWWERSSGTETKILLRQAMKGLLPDEVLAPRARRTGVTSGYSHRAMSESYPELLRELLERPMILEEMGIVRSDVLRKAGEGYSHRSDSFSRVNLFYTLQTELWLRAHQAGVADHGLFDSEHITDTLSATV